MMLALKILGVIFGLLMAGTGIHLMCVPLAAVDALSAVIPTVLGIVLTVSSVTRFIRWTQLKSSGASDGLLFWESVLGFVFGVSLLLSYWLRASIAVSFSLVITLWASLLLLSKGITGIVRAFQMKKANQTLVNWGRFTFNWVLQLVVGIALTLIGIISALNPLLTMAGIGIIVGVNVTIYGISMVFGSLVML
ncbi:MAG: hypothetical protein Q4C54_07585 [Clostridia bacterium]|nr:hypothetical protein [Clostridia bacterium]